jgi:hypothetical protein
MGRKFLKPIVSVFLSLSGLFSLSFPVKAITINFTNSATNEISEINALGLDISGSGNIDLTGGLGIDDFLVDNGESITFSFFDNFAASVGTISAILTLSDGTTGIPGAGTIEAFGKSGSLGIVSIENISPLIDVSGLFGNQLLKSFTFTADNGSGRNISGISYELIPNEVPDPSFLLGLGVIGIAGIRSLKRKKI